MTCTWKGNPHLASLRISQMSEDSFAFKQKIYCLFLQIDGWEFTKLAIFCGRHKCMTQTNSIIRSSSFFFNIKPQARYNLTAKRTTPPSPSLAPLPTPLLTKPKKLLLSVDT